MPCNLTTEQPISPCNANLRTPAIKSGLSCCEGHLFDGLASAEGAYKLQQAQDWLHCSGLVIVPLHCKVRQQALCQRRVCDWRDTEVGALGQQPTRFRAPLDQTVLDLQACV